MTTATYLDDVIVAGGPEGATYVNRFSVCDLAASRVWQPVGTLVT